MRRLLVSSIAAAAVCGLFATPSASAQQSVSFFLGGFMPRPIDARNSNDVILNDSTFLSTFNESSGIDLGKFNGATGGGEGGVPFRGTVSASRLYRHKPEPAQPGGSAILQ